MVDAIITKDVIGFLAPDESIAQYEQAYIDTIQDPAIKKLMTDDNERVLSRDLQSQIPSSEDYEGVDDGSQALEDYDSTTWSRNSVHWCIISNTAGNCCTTVWY
jgi:hypothetical protein